MRGTTHADCYTRISFHCLLGLDEHCPMKPERPPLPEEQCPRTLPHPPHVHTDFVERDGKPFRCPGLPTVPETITITVPRAAAERLAIKWEGDDGKSVDGYADLLVLVRDLFNGQDGYLHTLNDALGREH